MQLPFSEILKSIPGFFGIRLEEEPKYDVVAEGDGIEVRRYREALLAEVTIEGDHDTALDKAFDRLAAYIFGENVDRAKLPMTTPVAQEPRGEVMPMTTPVGQREEGGAWTVSFFLGNDIRPEDAPEPVDPGIRLRIEPARTVAVARYTGNNTDERRNEARERVRAWVERSPRFRAVGSVWWAQYDAPFVIPFLKRNEAQLEVVDIVG